MPKKTTDPTPQPEARLPEVPEFYADQFLLAANVWGAILVFAKQSAEIRERQLSLSGPTQQATVRMSLEHAKAMTMLMRRILRQWEADNNEIVIAESALNALELTQADW